ncbi:MAG: hypothetical protein JSV89_21280 [Spirochaetaceae bacterium]|nr:MAG: hypothetical protein JSV89_21280 [Spirochaetaceae bacterium]
MKRILFALIGLLALFTIIRAYAQEQEGESRYVIHPGILEFETTEGGARLAFGFLERSEERGPGRTWNLFPVRLSLRAGKQSFLIAMNGLSFLSPAGLRIGRPITIRDVKRGDVISIGGDVTVEGTVEGDVWTLGANINLLSGATVAGDAVALGGTVEADRRSKIGGNKQSLPNIKIPFLSLLSSEHSAATFRFIMEIMGVCLFLLLLFLFVHYGHGHLSRLGGVLSSRWKSAVLYLVLALLIVPVLIALLIVSVVGILIIPFISILVMFLAYAGYLAMAVRLGLWLRKSSPEVAPAAAYTTGLLGLLVLKGPVLLGILFTLLTADFFQGLGRFLSAIGTIAVAAATLYGLGGVLQYLREQVRGG